MKLYLVPIFVVLFFGACAERNNNSEPVYPHSGFGTPFYGEWLGKGEIINQNNPRQNVICDQVKISIEPSSNSRDHFLIRNSSIFCDSQMQLAITNLLLNVKNKSVFDGEKIVGKAADNYDRFWGGDNGRWFTFEIHAPELGNITLYASYQFFTTTQGPHIVFNIITSDSGGEVVFNSSVKLTQNNLH